MKKENPSARDKQQSADNQKNKPAENIDRDLIDDKQESNHSSSSPHRHGGPHKKPYEQQHEGIDQNVIPEQGNKIPGEPPEDVEEKSKNL
jgi:hypothetical protein